MKRALVALLLLGSVAACGAAPKAPSSPDPTPSSTPTPTLSATSTPTPSRSSSRPTPSASVRTSASKATSAASSAPVGTVVMSGGSFSTVAQITSASWIPADAKPFLSGILTKQQSTEPDCNWVLYIDAYRVADLISGGMGGCGGFDLLWGKSGGTWKQIIGGQAVPECSEIRKAWTGTIPPDFFGGTCMEGGAVVPFKP